MEGGLVTGFDCGCLQDYSCFAVSCRTCVSSLKRFYIFIRVVCLVDDYDNLLSTVGRPILMVNQQPLMHG